MSHLLIAYDVLVIMIGFAALFFSVWWRGRTGESYLFYFSILYGAFTLSLIVSVVRLYMLGQPKGMPIFNSSATKIESVLCTFQLYG